MPQVVQIKTLIINLLNEDKKSYLPIDRLQKFMGYLYDESGKQGLRHMYQISYHINFGSIERILSYNQHIFGLDASGENICLRENQSIDELVKRYPVDETIHGMIKNFVETA